MGTRLRQWAIRLLAAVALPIMLTLGLGAAANAQSVQASHVTSSTEHPSPRDHWEVYGPFGSRRACVRAQREFGGPDSYCEVQYRDDYRGEYWVWYLYVPHCDCHSRNLKE
jgi:hypothetical protein